MIAPVDRRRSRLGWGVTDQVLSSLTNSLLALVMIRSVSLDDVGAFSLVLAVYAFTIGVFRAFAAKPFAIRLAAAGSAEQQAGMCGLAGLAVAAGAVVGLVVLGAGALLGGTLGGLLAVLGLGLAGLLLQDAVRFAWVTTGHARRAAMNDGLWLALTLVGLVLTAGSGEAAPLLAVWVAGGVVAGVVAATGARAVPHPAAARRFLREHGRLSAPLGAEQAVSQGSNQVGLFVLAGILPLSDLGSLRSAQLMMSPLNVVQQAAPLVGLPEARRQRERGVEAVRPVVIRIGVVLAGLAIALAGFWLILPDSIGEAVFADGWAAGQPLVLAVGMRNAFGGLGLAAVIGLHTLEQTRSTLTIGVVRGLASIGAGVGGGVMFGLQGAVWCLAAAEALGAGLAIHRCAAATRGHATPPEGASASASPIVETAERR